MQPLPGFASCQHWGGGGGGGSVGHVRRLSEYLLWIVGSWGGISSPHSSSGMKMALKNWAGMDFFPFTVLLVK